MTISLSRIRSAARTVVAVCAVGAAFAAFATPARAVQGVNYAWCRYPGFSSWLGSSFSNTSSLMNGDFSLISSGGHNGSVRIWIFPDGTSNVNLSGTVSSTFRNNIKSVVSAANSHGLSVYVTFFSAWNLGDATTGNEVNLWNDDINPILSDLVGHYNIFGIDVMNEFDGTGSNSAFCQYIVGQVKSHYSISVTASSNQSYSTAVSHENTIGGTFLDIHVYQNSPVSLPTNSSGKTGVIGEIGSSSGGVSAQQSTLTSVLSSASSKGWSSVFAWDFATDDSWELTNAGQNWAAVSYNAAGTYWNTH
jgi:hypothetical protein